MRYKNSFLFPFLLCLIVASHSIAAEFFVSPTGLPTNSGSMAAPWDLKTALCGGPNSNLCSGGTASPTVIPGDTLWLRGGTYNGPSVVSFSGSSIKPIIVRNFSNERAVLDGSLRLAKSTHVYFWGLEIVDSAKMKQPTNPFDTVSGGGVGTKFVNCVIHDTNIGLGGGAYEAYGNVMYYNGATSLEHPIYWQNNYKVSGEKKVIKDNLIFNSAAFGIHSYSSQGELNGLVFDGNVLWHNGALLNDYKDDILLGGGKPVDVADIDNNLLYGDSRGIRLGWSFSPNISASLKNNYIAIKNDPFIIAKEFNTLTFTGNTLVVGAGELVQAYAQVGSFICNNNTYYSANGAGTFLYNLVAENYSQWKARGYDSSSTFVANAKPLKNKIFVKKNQYDPGRVVVVVYNWENLTQVSVNLSDILNDGDLFDLRKAENYFSPLAVNQTYNGSVVLPMTNKTVATPIGFSPPRSTFPEFGAFLIERTLGHSVPSESPLPSPTPQSGEGGSQTKLVFNPMKGERLHVGEFLNGEATIEIRDAKGWLVRTFEGAGPSTEWDGRNEKGNIVSAGVYIVKFPGGTKKIIVLK